MQIHRSRSVEDKREDSKEYKADINFTCLRLRYFPIEFRISSTVEEKLSEAGKRDWLTSARYLHYNYSYWGTKLPKTKFRVGKNSFNFFFVNKIQTLLYYFENLFESKLHFTAFLTFYLNEKIYLLLRYEIFNSVYNDYFLILIT